MISLLLAAANDLPLGIAIFLFIAAIGIVLGNYLKSKMDVTYNDTKSGEFTGRVNVALKEPYIHGKSFKFYNLLQRSLPAEFISFPNVGVDTIVKPAGDLVAYNAIGGKYVDFCIFEKSSMKPVAVIDLIDPSISTTPITKQEEAISKSLTAISIPVLEFSTEEKISEDELLKRFLQSQDIITLTRLQKAREEKESNRR